MNDQTIDLLNEIEFCTVSTACNLLHCLGYDSSFYTANYETLQSFVEENGKDNTCAFDFHGVTFESKANNQWYSLTLGHLLADCILESISVYGIDVTEMSLGIKYVS